MNYRSNSPGDGTNCVSSAPPSPVSQSLSPASSPGLAQSPASPFTDQSVVMNIKHEYNQVDLNQYMSTILAQFIQFFLPFIFFFLFSIFRWVHVVATQVRCIFTIKLMCLITNLSNLVW